MPNIDPMVDAYEEHARALGAVTIAWTGAQESLFMVFRELADLPPAHAETIFFSLTADSAQRDITLALAEEVLTDTPDLLKRLSSFIKTMRKDAGERNAAIHTMWRANRDNGRIEPSPITLRHHGRLKEDHRAQFYALADKMSEIDGDLVQLALDVRLHLASQRKHPLPPPSPEDSVPAGSALRDSHSEPPPPPPA